VIVIGLGGNMPDGQGHAPIMVLRAAVEALRTLPGLRLRLLSPFYATAPLPPSGQPPYVNAVASLEGCAEPARLLSWLQSIEARAGRVRGRPNAARTLDLDIVAMHNCVRDEPDPVLPHPRLHERAFVLRPLADIAPGWMHPRLGRTIGDLLARLPPQEITRL
jgi:2-amino-4-hydroxy-6-hydroxymethyldihydropteridine diphosphokinase